MCGGSSALLRVAAKSNSNASGNFREVIREWIRHSEVTECKRAHQFIALCGRIFGTVGTLRAMNFTIPGRPAVFTLTRALVSTGFFCVAASVLFPQVQPSTNRSKAFGPDACGPADPAYIHSANETGGIPMFLQRSEAAKAFHLVRESTRNNVSTVFWATGTLDGKPQAITIPVDSVTKRITITFSVDTKG